MTTDNRTIINNPQHRDSSGKLIFGDNILCSQFLRHYAGIEILRNIRPEDLEDVSERYVPLYSTERESDTVKRVNLAKYIQLKEDENPLELPLYIVSLVEHKTKVEYNVAMQILRYMIYIWEDYEKEMDRKHPYLSTRKDFRYPPILPIVYYEGEGTWTAFQDLADRILCKELMGDYLPHFKYQMVRLCDYSNEELLARGEEISLAMLINKIRCVEDMEAFTRLPDDRVDEILKDTPEYLLDTLGKLLRALLYSMNLEEEITENAVSKIKERKMGRLFEGVTFDFQAEKRAMREEREKAKEEIEKAKEEIEKAKEEIEKAKEEIEKAKEEIEKAKEERKKAKEEIEKAKEEIEKAKEEKEKSKEEREKAKEEREKSKEQIKKVKEETKGKIERTQKEIMIAKKIAKLLRQDCSDMEIRETLIKEFDMSEAQADEAYRNVLED